MKKAKALLAVLLALAMTLALAACGNAGEPAQTQPAQTQAATAAPAAGDVTLTFWHTYSEGEEAIFLSEIVPAFEAANPGIKIDAVKMPVDGLQEQVITAASGDAAPDVMRMDLTWVAQFAKLGALQSVSGLDGFDGIKSNALSAPMETGYYGGEYYGLPLNTNTTTAVWNMDLLKEFGAAEPPATIDELVALAR